MTGRGGKLTLGKKNTPEQVITKLAEGDQMLNEGDTLAEVARITQPCCVPCVASQAQQPH